MPASSENVKSTPTSPERTQTEAVAAASLVAAMRRFVRVVSGARKAARMRSPTVAAVARSCTARASSTPQRTTGPGSPIGGAAAAPPTSAAARTATAETSAIRAKGARGAPAPPCSCERTGALLGEDMDTSVSRVGACPCTGSPEDVPGLVEAYTQTVRAIIDLGRSCSPTDFNKPTPARAGTSRTRSPTSSASSSGSPAPPCPGEPSRVRPRPHRVRPDRRVDGGAAAQHAGLEGRRRARGRAGEAGEPARGPGHHRRHPDPGHHRAGAGARRPPGARARHLDARAGHPPGSRSAWQPRRARGLRLHGPAVRSAAQARGEERRYRTGNVVIFDVTGPVVGRSGVRVEIGEGGKPLGTRCSPARSTTTPKTSRSPASRCRQTPSPAGRRAGRPRGHPLHRQGDEDVARRVLEALPFTP